MIKVRRRPTPDRDLPPGYQHGYWPHRMEDLTVRLRRADGWTVGEVRAGDILTFSPFHGWNVIEGDHQG